MKKQLFSFGIFFSAIVLVSCGNNSGDAGNASTDSGTNTSTSDNAGGMASDTANTATPAATANNVGDTEKTFMMDAASGGMMEVQLGQLAAQNASSDRVKAFGNMMVQDHTNANNELKALATTKNVMLPDSMMAKHRKHIDMLKAKTGKAFDNSYMGMMVTDHNEDVNKFQVASNNAADADVKNFATKTLPVLRMHLDSAKAINSMKK